MSFLLDSNTLIQGKNEAYGFDICPGFWTFIENEHQAGRLFSLKPVGEELIKGKDELAQWARKRGNSFFLPIDSATAEAMVDIANWVQARDFTDAAKATLHQGGVH